ncbi:hypothetical protein KAH37_08825 [bacterium]|nr:hypothetical protein [bacterium]
MKKIIIIFLLSITLLLPLLAKKERAIPYHPPAEYYFYLSKPLPDYILSQMIEKKGNPALLYSIKASNWLRKNIAALKESHPLFFIEGSLSKLELLRLHELLKALEYDATVIHILKSSETLSFSPLFRSYYTISLKNKETTLVYNKKSAKALFLSPSDKFDFHHTISITDELSFPALKHRFIASNSLSEDRLKSIKSHETIIFFFQKEKKLSYFLENW